MVAGHSLGEFSALAAAEAISFEDAFVLSISVPRHAALLRAGAGTMAAIIGLPDEKVERSAPHARAS